MAINTPREILQTQIATHNATSPVGSEIMTNMTGRSKTTSESVTVSTNNTDITDALEELGMAKATRGKKDLETMKARRGQGADLDALTRIADYYDKLPDLPSDQKNRDLVLKMQSYEEFFSQEKGQGGSGLKPTADDIRQLLQEFDGDITHQFAALESAAARFSAAGPSSEFMALLDEVRQEMREGDAAQDIKAGFFSAQEASTAPERFATPPEVFRESYRQMVRSGGHLGRIFDALGDFVKAGNTGKENFENAIDSFIKVAGADMQSFGPSTDPIILGDVVAELKNLKNMRTILEMGQGLIDKLSSMFPSNKDVLPDSAEITSLLLDFTSSSVASAMDAQKMVERFSDMGPDVAVVALNILRDIHSQMPDSAMPTDGARLQQSKILMNLSDKLVAVEENSFAAQS